MTYLIKNKIILSIVLFCSVAGLAAGIFLVQSKSTPTIDIAGHEIVAELAITDADKERGLSYRDALPEGSGLLFVYNNYLIPSFWMKGMKFPIDIIWIKDAMVAGYEKNVPIPVGEQYLIYRPVDFINRVLEVNAGFVDKNDIKIGDAVTVNQ